MPNQPEQDVEQQTKDVISVPRWIVYFQGALLGIVATTFFVFGLMVGDLTSGSDPQTTAKIDCRVYGKVYYRSDGKNLPDSGAVVMLLPKNAKPQKRSNARLLNPDSFKPLENEGIKVIHGLGGAVVRVDERGNFDVKVDAPAEYNLLVVSKQREADPDEHSLTKAQKAMIGTFFIPVEDLLDDREFHWSDVYANSDQKAIDIITFQ